MLPRRSRPCPSSHGLQGCNQQDRHLPPVNRVLRSPSPKPVCADLFPSRVAVMHAFADGNNEGKSGIVPLKRVSDAYSIAIAGSKALAVPPRNVYRVPVGDVG